MVKLDTRWKTQKMEERCIKKENIYTSHQDRVSASATQRVEGRKNHT
jgi:hypothetical protein